MEEAYPYEVSVGRIEPCRIIKVPEIVDSRGSLSAIEGGEALGFDFKRVYYLYNMPLGTVRGAHAHRNLQQLLLAMHGSFDVVVEDGSSKATFHLDNPTYGLYIGPMVWRNLVNFSPEAVGLVLASEHYDEADYYRHYDDFLRDARSLP
ncbi:WxcM-like domain-containing protein [Streptomyces armeniacus]|uniref:WxcM-like domain-containing protein n=1 Tax=Streptomyces armeniacus TaxID=83291 RepID=A0A345XP03_9ACTN|nr:FdtA/QdtA family cupin domain-containing protein [Streptomyces armeniacus]AXK33369.1 WxcM-like domain-containing protein [Streptomyces armeniacus]